MNDAKIAKRIEIAKILPDLTHECLEGESVWIDDGETFMQGFIRAMDRCSVLQSKDTPCRLIISFPKLYKPNPFTNLALNTKPKQS